MDYMLKQKDSRHWTPEELHFSVLAIEAAAKKMKISPGEMQRRLKAQNLIDNYIVKYYEVFHTMRLGHVADEVILTLND